MLKHNHCHCAYMDNNNYKKKLIFKPEFLFQQHILQLIIK